MPKKKIDLDPRQTLFLQYYFDKDSDTFANATQSGIKAGYDADYANQLTAVMPDWLAKRVQHSNLISKAERNLDNLLDGEDDKVKADMTKFALSRLDKEHYSERIENTGNKDRIEVIITDFHNTEHIKK